MRPPAGLRLPAREQLLLLFALFLAGCATVPVEDVPEPPPGVDAEMNAFLLAVHSKREGFDLREAPGFFLLLDVKRSSGLVNELEDRGFPDVRTARRSDYVLAALFPGKPLRVWIGGRFPRFWTAVALSSRGWRRREPGVWHDGEGTEVRLYRGGLLRFESNAWSVEALDRGSEGVESGVTVIDILQGGRDDAALLLFLSDPPMNRLPGGLDLGALKPRSVQAIVDGGDELDLAVRFAAEREARVVLVTLRFLSPQLLQAMYLTPGERFAVAREGTIVRLSGATLSDRSWRLLVDAVLPREEERSQEDRQ